MPQQTPSPNERLRECNHEAVVSLVLRGPEGQTREVNAVIDTGYSGFLTLPAALVADLGLPYVFSSSAVRVQS